MVTVVARSQATNLAHDGLRRARSQNTTILAVISHRLTRRSSGVVVPSISRLLAPLLDIIPTRLLTCCADLNGNLSISGPHGLTGSIAMRWLWGEEDN